MFYCDNCAKQKNWPESLFKSVGRCEICKSQSVCNDIHTTKLPIRTSNTITMNGSQEVKDNQNALLAAGKLALAARLVTTANAKNLSQRIEQLEDSLDAYDKEILSLEATLTK